MSPRHLLLGSSTAFAQAFGPLYPLGRVGRAVLGTMLKALRQASDLSPSHLVTATRRE